VAHRLVAAERGPPGGAERSYCVVGVHSRHAAPPALHLGELVDVDPVTSIRDLRLRLSSASTGSRSDANCVSFTHTTSSTGPGSTSRYPCVLGPISWRLSAAAKVFQNATARLGLTGSASSACRTSGTADLGRETWHPFARQAT